MKKIVRLTERDLSRIVRRVISETKEMSKEDIERELTSMAKFEFNIFKNYGDSDRPKYKKMFDERNDENTIYVNLNKHFMKGDDFYKFIEPVKKYLKDNDNKASLGKYNFKLDGNEIKITKEDNISERQIKRILNRILMEQPSNVYQTKKEYELGRGSGVDFTLEAGNKFKKATQDNADAIVSPPIGEFPDYGGIRSGEGVPFRPEGIVTKLIFNCIPQQRSTHRKNEKSKLHLFVHGDEKELIFPVFNNELESELTNVFCKR